MITADSILVPPKIQPCHRERLAVVYIRQSTPQQVLEHRESAALQYALRERAVAWGWSESRIIILDTDLGHSGQSAQGREGFQRLLAEVSLDHVGLVLGIEMSRLARSCRDWHQLLELCALFGVLLADADGLYDPRDYNDRLLLGLKGTLSEAELHLLRQRMNQGRLNKARRGELFNHPPIGYVRDASGLLNLDPDQQVQGVVRMVFESFQRLGTINATLAHLARNHIRLPVRAVGGPEHGQLQWRTPNRQTLRNLLHHPVYAGAYTWGRRAVDPRRQVPGRPATGRQVVAPEECQVFLPGRCPAYITWEQYQANQRTMAANQARAHALGVARDGSLLLGGLLVCGICGRRMAAQYHKAARYACTRNRSDYAQPVCQGICGRTLDTLVQTLALAVLRPAALELSLAAEADQEQQRRQLESHWRQRLERAAYDVDRAARQYHAVEPENRLVARELEKRWEQALAAQRQAQEDHDRFLREQPSALSEDERQMIRSLAQDIPALWRATEVTAAQRKTIVRHLIEQVTLTAPPDSEAADVTVRWAGGFVSQHQVIRPVARYEQMRDYEALCGRLAELKASGLTYAQVAEQLNAEGFRPPKRVARFNANMVRELFYRRGLARSRPSPHALGADEWWFTDLARELGLPHPTLYTWLRRGWVHSRRLEGRWVLWADQDELARLRKLRTCPKGWHNQPQAADLAIPKPRPVVS